MKLRRFGLLVSALVLSDAFSLRRCTAVLLWMLRGRWSAPAESGMSHLVNQRMGKRQPMCWSLEGAHFLLQVRCAVLDGRLETLFREWHPRFRLTPTAVKLPAM